jgi:hypothetical protein
MAASEPSAGSVKDGAPSGPRSFLSADEKPWKVWWLWGVPVAWIASALVIGAEESRIAGLQSLGDLMDVARLAVYWIWCRKAWQCSANAPHRAWELLSKAVLAAGFVATVFI